MPADLLALFPLLAGYLFVHITYFWRFRAQPLSGHRLVFEAAIAGFVFVPVAHLIVLGLLRTGLTPDWLLMLWPDELDPGHATLVTSAAVAPIVAGAWNVVEGVREDREDPDGACKNSRWKWMCRVLSMSRKRALRRAVRRKASELEQLVYQAATESVDDGSMLAVTLQSRKIYLGWVVKAPNLERRRGDKRYLSFLPVLSGHRTPDQLRAQYTYAYNVKERLNALEGDADKKAEDLLVYIPVSEVESARLLQSDDYEELIEELESVG